MVYNTCRTWCTYNYMDKMEKYNWVSEQATKWAKQHQNHYVNFKTQEQWYIYFVHTFLYRWGTKTSMGMIPLSDWKLPLGRAMNEGEKKIIV